MNLYKGILNCLILLFIVLYPILPSYGAINSDLILYLLALIQIIGLIVFKDERKDLFKNLKLLINDKIFLFVIFLNSIMYFSVLVAEDKRIALVGSIRFSMYIFIYYSIAYKLKIKNSVTIIMTSFLGVASLSGIVSLIQLVILNFSNIQLSEEHRISSLLENSNNLGAYTILSIFIVLLLLLNEKEKKMKMLLLISFFLLIANIILSQSRNALLALFIGSLLVAIIYDKRILIFSILLPVILLIIPQSRYRILDILNPEQNSSRVKIWKIAELIIKDKPYFGSGYDNFAIKYPNYVYHNPELMIHGSYKALHPHNIFLKIQSELGIIGTILFILFIIAVLFTLYKSIKKTKDSKIKSLLIGITISFISFNFMNLIDCYYSTLKVITTMFVIISIITVINRNKIGYAE
ncbi:O-antigen ligase family protein [Clostridium nigeriense]|uniref:O-antigen ligase family protein n=1 Tax=Clostridium nigeriense TaxID=1805470 RepID=UPI003D3249D9